ncbi:MAG: MTH1187 family thiamine-binding protein [Pirellulales bacterium]|nr:MTH1187 family thiamine-binding protein [Pirellulales bacterium]
MLLLELSIFPLDKGESVSPYVARCLDIIDRSGVHYRGNSMGTVLEGGYAEVMDVVRQCFEALAVDCNRIECSMKLDYRKGRTNRLEAKIASVEQKLGRKLRT